GPVRAATSQAVESRWARPRRRSRWRATRRGDGARHSAATTPTRKEAAPTRTGSGRGRGASPGRDRAPSAQGRLGRPVPQAYSQAAAPARAAVPSATTTRRASTAPHQARWARLTTSLSPTGGRIVSDAGMERVALPLFGRARAAAGATDGTLSVRGLALERLLGRIRPDHTPLTHVLDAWLGPPARRALPLPLLQHPPHEPSRHHRRHGREGEGHQQVRDEGELLEAQQEVAQEVELVADGVDVDQRLDPLGQLHHPAAADGEHADATQLLAQVVGDVEEAHAADHAPQREDGP